MSSNPTPQRHNTPRNRARQSAARELAAREGCTYQQALARLDAPPPIHVLFQAVREHPDYAFGTIFVKGDFPHELVPEDFPANRATDHLAEAGNFYIAFECGEREDDGDWWWESTAETDIFELLARVREHPDYVFGTIFVPGDFPGNIVPEDFSGRWGEDTLAQAGNEYIYDIVGDADEDDDGEE